MLNVPLCSDPHGAFFSGAAVVFHVVDTEVRLLG